jgi:hypothetical protein
MTPKVYQTKSKKGGKPNEETTLRLRSDSGSRRDHRVGLLDS